jgi:Protein of unknown function (DUF1353)
MQRAAVIGTIGSVLVLLAMSISAFATGKFVGNPVAQWEADGRSMTLVESFEYVDVNGRSWKVPSGVRVDGASIPQIFWTLIGGPFEGKYRNASLIHDYFCENRKRRWQEVHKVFHEAMLTSGVENAKAFVMYKAVEKFGPRWDEPKIDPKCLKPNGKFNFERCTENSGVVQGPMIMPPVGKRELESFIKEIDSVAKPEDLEALKALAERSQ